MEFKDLFSVLKKRMSDGDDVPYFFREIISMITDVTEEEWGTPKDPATKRTKTETLKNYVKRGLSKKFAQSIVYRLTPDILIERIEERPETVRTLLADDLKPYDPSLNADTVAEAIADWMVDIIRRSAGLVPQDELANGYLNRKKETKEAFLNNPFDGDKSGFEKMYKTGDMVRVLPDGTLGFIGRKDSQVKIRGNRVELGEVEACIRQLDFVKDCTVVAISNDNVKELVSYVVLNKDNVDKNIEDITEEIIKYISDNKPAYMVPAFVEIIDEIPLNVNGKVDKRALPKVNINKFKTSYVAPTNETEKIIVEAFEKVLGQKNIGTEDDFIRLGGDSLSAIRVVANLSENNIDIDAKTILEKRTPKAIANEAFVNANVKAEVYNHVEGEVKLLPIQSYFFDQINSNKFVQTFALKSKITLNKEILQKSLDILINHHDMLRASYKKDGNKVIQRILSQGSSTLHLDCIESTEENVRHDIVSKMHEGINSLDIYNSKLIYILLTDTGTANYLTIAIHHLVIDGIS